MVNCLDCSTEKPDKQAVAQARYQHWTDLAATAAKLCEPPPIIAEFGLSSVSSVDGADGYLAHCLSAHLDAEFPDVCCPNDWGTWAREDAKRLPYILRMVSRRRTFVGTCEICKSWQETTDDPLAVAKYETQEVATRFMEYKKGDLRPASRESYSGLLKTFAKKFPIWPTTPEPVEEYIFGKPTARTMRLIYTVLSECYEYAHNRLGTPDVMAAIKRPRKGTRKEADYLTLDQLRLLSEAIHDDRDRGLFSLMAYEGFRRVEPLRTNVEDVFENRVRVHGKEGEEWMPLLPEIRELLLKIAAGRSGDQPVFVTHTTGERLGVKMTWVIVRNWFKRAGIIGIKASPHTLRHTFCTLMQVAGCDRLSVELLMRHRTPNTTDIYSHVSIEERLHLLRPKLEKYSPLRQLNGHKPAIRLNQG